MGELTQGNPQISRKKMEKTTSGLFFAVLLSLAAAAAAAPALPVAPAPAPEPLSLTGILEKGSQYTTLLRLLKETQIGTQLQSQLKNSYDGITLFAPTDNAFNSLKPGTLNKLTPQDQVALLLYHVIPRFYTFDIFQTASNPIRTQATGENGVFTLNITAIGQQQVNISTGVVTTPITNVMYKTFPLAVYSIEAVLLPYDLFGPVKTVKSPPPPPPVVNATKTNSTSGDDAAPANSAAAGLPAAWLALATAAALFCMGFSS